MRSRGMLHTCYVAKVDCLYTTHNCHYVGCFEDKTKKKNRATNCAEGGKKSENTLFFLLSFVLLNGATSSNLPPPIIRIHTYVYTHTHTHDEKEAVLENRIIVINTQFLQRQRRTLHRKLTK